MKKFLTGILAVCLCFATVFAFASCGCDQDKQNNFEVYNQPTEPDYVDENGVGYHIVDSKELQVTQYTGTSAEVTVPASYENLPVTSIGASAFKNTQITKVTLPDSIKVIGEHSFSLCNNLESITIPEGVETIEKYAFFYTPALKEITIPQSITTLEQSVFSASGLVKCEIPSSITKLEPMLFYQCFDLEEVIIPETVTSFDKDIFTEDEKVTIVGKAGSEAEAYAKEQNIKFSAQ